jgi:hypothetical protein
LVALEHCDAPIRSDLFGVVDWSSGVRLVGLGLIWGLQEVRRAAEVKHEG